MRFIIVRTASGSAVALFHRVEGERALIEKWRSPQHRFARPRWIAVADIVGDAKPTDPRRRAAERWINP